MIGIALLLAAIGRANPAAMAYATPAGTLRIELPGEHAGWVAQQPNNAGDLLFPDGVTLVALRESGEAGVMVTISLDHNHPVAAPERAAFGALAQERAADGRMEVWQVGERQWILQEFRSPSERVLAAQTFVGPYALAYLFWFGAEASIEHQEACARAVLSRWGPGWEPATPAPAEH